VASLVIVTVSVLAWAAVKTYLLMERLAWVLVRRFLGF